MRFIASAQISERVSAMLREIVTTVPGDLLCLLRQEAEKSEGVSALVMSDIIENAILACERRLPLCQDTGMVVCHAQMGHCVQLEEPLQTVLDKAVAATYRGERYRPSVVCDPLKRKNTGDNSPAVLHLEHCEGEFLQLQIMVKGFGSENMSCLRMLKPAEGYQGVKDFVIETVRNAGGNPCPPVIVGVGVGGTFDQVALLAKRALFRDLHSRHSDPDWAAREDELLRVLNELGIGPGGLGGYPTALDVRIETAPTHIAGLPVAVNICCHSSRHGTVKL